MPEFKVDNPVLWKWAGFTATVATVAMQVAGIITDEQFVQVVAIFAALGLWIMPSPTIRTGGK